jgi:hypothetical protein
LVATQLAAKQQELESAKRQLAESKQLMEQMAQQGRQHTLPPLENAELRIFHLLHVPAPSAAEAIETLFGADGMRVAVDDRTNSLIMLAKPESLKVIEALLMNLDQKHAKDSDKKQSQPSKEEAKQSLLLRLFWLADGLPEGEGADPVGVLPVSVLEATKKLSLVNPRLVTQAVNALASGGDSADFSADVPAVLMKRTALLNYGGTVRLSAAEKVAVTMKVNVHGEGVNSNLHGSLSMPLGHYMVLGTANSVIPEMAANAEAAREPGPGAPEGEFGSGLGREPGRLIRGAMAPERPQPPTKFNTARFAFVVQVVGAESFPPEDPPPLQPSVVK